MRHYTGLPDAPATRPAARRDRARQLRLDRLRHRRHRRRGADTRQRRLRPAHPRPWHGRAVPALTRPHERGSARQVRLPLRGARGLGSLSPTARGCAHGEDAQCAGRGHADRRVRAPGGARVRRRADRSAPCRVGAAAALLVRGHRCGDARAARSLRRPHLAPRALDGSAARRDRHRSAARCHRDDHRARRRAGRVDARHRVGRARCRAAVPAGRPDATRRRTSGDPPVRAALEHRDRARVAAELARAAAARRRERGQAGRALPSRTGAAAGLRSAQLAGPV